jgi:hypothetical protein
VKASTIIHKAMMATLTAAKMAANHRTKYMHISGAIQVWRAYSDTCLAFREAGWCLFDAGASSYALMENYPRNRPPQPPASISAVGHNRAAAALWRLLFGEFRGRGPTAYETLRDAV